jgi:hypothetical protein
MKIIQSEAKSIFALAMACVLISVIPAAGQKKESVPLYQIYAGNTHSHTIYTLSHGAQWNHVPGATKFMRVDSAGVSQVINSVLKPDWQKLQGPPSAHFNLAKDNGYDFYAVTDHSQEPDFHPTSPDNTAWLAIQQSAKEVTDNNFVGIRGFEYSENNGPGGKGHINVYNTASYLNALEVGYDLPYFYNWLTTVPPNGDGAVVACFNHPGPTQYSDWDDRTPEATDIITMLEVINSNNHVHYSAFIKAMDKGWKVSPVCGNDNHGFGGITTHTSRTFVLATARTKAAILDAMKNRRTYASLDNNIQCRYTVNGKIMGSTLEGEKVLKFSISISDPDINKPNDKITRIDIVKDGGEVAQTYNVPTPAHNVKWSPTIKDATNKYFFIRVWNAGGGDAPKANPEKPIAWLAPVWTGQ